MTGTTGALKCQVIKSIIKNTLSVFHLNALVTQEIKVPLSGMVDALVHHGPRQSVPVAVLVVVSWEEPAEKYSVKIRRFSPANYLVW